jgi:dihydrodipicolinate synthase/N-acetylneuraminate lyase
MLATCVLPWGERGALDEKRFRAQVRRLATTLTEHLYVLGTAGEGYAVSDRQFAQVATAFAAEAAAVGARPMIGVISLSLATIVERIELALELGVRELQLSFPSWGALSDREVERFFAETCGRFPQARFLHYNNPRAARVLRGADYVRLADAHENLAAVKFTSSDPAVVEELVAGAAPLCCYLTEEAFALAADAHECGLLTSVVHADAALAREYHSARGSRLRELLAIARAIDAALTASVADREVHMDGAYDKLVARLHDSGFPLRLLPPYGSADDDDFAAFAEAAAAALSPTCQPARLHR